MIKIACLKKNTDKSIYSFKEAMYQIFMFQLVKKTRTQLVRNGWIVQKWNLGEWHKFGFRVAQVGKAKLASIFVIFLFSVQFLHWNCFLPIVSPSRLVSHLLVVVMFYRFYCKLCYQILFNENDSYCYWSMNCFSAAMLWVWLCWRNLNSFETFQCIELYSFKNVSYL